MRRYYRSKRRYLERRHVLDAHRFVGEEWLAVSRANARSVVRGLMPDDVEKRIAVRLHFTRLLDSVEL
jgi:hypothetical protein